MKNHGGIGLALGSGGLRGLAHIGIIKVLIKNNIPIKIISGSSIGSLIGSYYALYGEIDSLEELLINNSEEITPLFFDVGLKGGFIQGKKLKKYLEKTLGRKEFKDTLIPFYSISTDIITGQSETINSGCLATAVTSSAAIPVVFKPIKHENKLLVDGGLSDPVPVKILKHSGANKTIAVNLYHENEFKERKFTMPIIAIRCARIALHNLSKISVKEADVVLNPDTSVILNKTKVKDYFKPEIVKSIIEIGEKEAQKNLKKIKALI